MRRGGVGNQWRGGGEEKVKGWSRRERVRPEDGEDRV